MIKPVSLSTAHMESASIAESVPVLTDLLGFEEQSRAPGEVTLRHHDSQWVLTVHEVPERDTDRPRYHHFGVRVEKKAEVDNAWEYINLHQEEYGLLHMDPQVFRHGSYSIHFQEPGTNFWEIECYEDVLRKDSGAERLGGVRSRHWTEPRADDPALGRGFAPQAFTHGTLGVADLDRLENFATQVLGLEVHRAYATARYVKHPDSKHYVVCLRVDEPHTFSPNFRFTVTLDGPEAVEAAHAELTHAKTDLGIAEVRPVETNGAGASFLIADADRNWWEIAG
jgi:catechol 2,3-dioxygenase-like lactoylglutathione lyase family enzyme